MRRFLGPILVALAAGCGGGGIAPAPQSSGLTAQELVEQCVAGDLADLNGLFAVVQGLIDGSGPAPEFDLLAGLLSGIVPYTLDIDDDGTDDLSGTVHFRNAAGQVTIPVSDLDALLNGELGLPEILAQIPPGTSFHVTFSFDGTLAGAAPSDGGTGELVFAFDAGGGDLSAVRVSGDGSLRSAECVFDFAFSDVPADRLGGFPVAEIAFTLRAGSDRLLGTVTLDGTSIARVEAALGGAAPEVFLVDLLAPPALAPG
jgi:hypothetical protein